MADDHAPVRAGCPLGQPGDAGRVDRQVQLAVLEQVLPGQRDTSRTSISRAAGVIAVPQIRTAACSWSSASRRARRSCHCGNVMRISLRTAEPFSDEPDVAKSRVSLAGFHEARCQENHSNC